MNIKNLFFSAALCILALGSSAFAQDKTQNDADIFFVEIDGNNSLSAAKESLSKGTLESHDEVTYIYTNAKYVRFSMKEGVEKEAPGIIVEAAGPDFNGSFYRSNLSKMNGKSDGIYRTASKNSMATVGLNDGGYPGIKLKIGGHEMHIRRPNGEDWKPSFSEVSLDIKLKGSDDTPISKKVAQTDTIKIEEGQTIQSVSFKKPKYATVKSLSYKFGKDIKSEILDQANTLKNLTYDEPTLEFKPTISAEDLASCESIALDFVVLDSIGIRQQIETVYFPVKFEDSGKGGKAWIWIVIGALLLALIAAAGLYFLVFKKKKKKKESKADEEEKNNEPHSGKTGEAESVEKTSLKDATDTPEKKEESKTVETEGEPVVEPEAKSENKPEVSAEVKDEAKATVAAVIPESQKEVERLNNEISRLNIESEEAKKLFASEKAELESKINELTASRDELAASLDTEKKGRESAEQSAEALRENLKIAKDDAQKANAATENLRVAKDHERAELIGNYERRISDNEKANRTVVENLQKERDEIVSEKDGEIEAIKEILSIDRSIIKDFYIRKLDAVKASIDKVENSSDHDSAVYPLIEKMAKSITGINSFAETYKDIVKADSSIKTIFEEVKQTLVGDLDYDQSWCNNLARIYAYSRIDNEDFKEIFGYSGSYKQGIEKAFNEMISLAEVFGIKGITVPKILTEPFDDNRYDFKNDSSVIMKIYPETSDLIKSGYIFDIIKVGYTDSGRQAKATVAYYL